MILRYMMKVGRENEEAGQRGIDSTNRRKGEAHAPQGGMGLGFH